MELIDKTKLEAFGATCKSQDYMDGVKDTLEYIDNLPTVDAIPVQWLYALAELAEKKESETDIKLSLMIKGVVALWHREQEK